MLTSELIKSSPSAVGTSKVSKPINKLSCWLLVSLSLATLNLSPGERNLITTVDAVLFPARICFNSMSTSFQSGCVYCDSRLYASTLTACTGSPVLSNNVTQAQAFCIATACLQVPVLKKPNPQPFELMAKFFERSANRLSIFKPSFLFGGARRQGEIQDNAGFYSNNNKWPPAYLMPQHRNRFTRDLEDPQQMVSLLQLDYNNQHDLVGSNNKTDDNVWVVAPFEQAAAATATATSEPPATQPPQPKPAPAEPIATTAAPVQTSATPPSVTTTAATPITSAPATTTGGPPPKGAPAIQVSVQTTTTTTTTTTTVKPVIMATDESRDYPNFNQIYSQIYHNQKDKTYHWHHKHQVPPPIASMSLGWLTKVTTQSAGQQHSPMNPFVLRLTKRKANFIGFWQTLGSRTIQFKIVDGDDATTLSSATLADGTAN